MKYQHIFFDLDGTLTDSADGIVNSVRYALEKQGIVPPAREQLLPFVGPPLLDSFHKYYGMDREQGMQAIEAYREYFTDRGWKENSVYEGIPEVLKQLKEILKIQQLNVYGIQEIWNHIILIGVLHIHLQIGFQHLLFLKLLIGLKNIWVLSFNQHIVKKIRNGHMLLFL